MATAAIGERPKGLRLLKTALANRKTAIMLVFGFAAGLPYTLLIGTLNAWLGEWQIDLATIGVLSWLLSALDGVFAPAVAVAAAVRTRQRTLFFDQADDRNAARALIEAVKLRRAGKLPKPDHGLREPRPK